METLLKKVQGIELEAKQLIAQAEEQESKTLSNIQSREGKTIAETRAAAESRANEIIQEKVRATEQEVNAIKQQGEHAVKTVHEAAEKNRADALALARQLFNDTYITQS